MDIYFYTVKLAKFLALVQTYNGGFYSGRCPIEQRDIGQTSSGVRDISQARIPDYLDWEEISRPGY